MFSPSGPETHGHGQDSMMMSSSPGSPGSSSMHAPSSPYLPGYLLGDHLSHHPSVVSKSSPRMWSSGSSQSSLQKSTMPPTPSGLGLIRQNSGRRTGGPPVKSLYSSPTDTQNQSSYPANSAYTSTPVLGVSSPAPPTAGLHSTPHGLRGDTSLLGLNRSQVFPMSPAQTDPFFTQGDLRSDDQLDDTWVTVFGFPPGATSFILQQFSQYGTILKHVVASECNWMHIHYQSKLQAKKALSKDGKVYGGCMKIGVTPCIEKSVMEEKENFINNSSMTLDTSLRTPDLSTTKLTSMRPLTAAYVASKGEYQVLQDRQTPKRESGLVSKLKEYMLGY